jgi:3-dehydroquinate synthase
MSKVYFRDIDFIQELLNATEYSQLFVLTDENSDKNCYPLLKQFLGDHHQIEIKSGELNKNLDTCSHIWSELTDATADRKSLLINLGGGVITDMGGFCAGTFKRGIKFINIPTTLLSQVDASVGAKTGIDFSGY